ncbi:MAG: FAD-binding oxidoreductase [Kiritimatiellae bacterium]|nr:FAD-binding oxidoreductase [Kiritimatiellia bacterium]
MNTTLPNTRSQALGRCAAALTERGIRCDMSAEACAAAAKDASQLKSAPLCVVRPATTAEVAATVRVCREHGLPVSVAGGYTGLSGGVLGYEAVRIETRQLRGFALEGDTVRCEAGASLPEVMRAAAKAGRLFPFQPASACRATDSYTYLGTPVGPVTVGGSIAANASGLVGCKLGAADRWVRELTVVWPTGRTATVAGVDAARFIGTEGRYGIITEAVVALAAWPDNIETWLLSGHGYDDFVAAARGIGASGVLPLLAECMVMGDAPPDFSGLVHRLFDDGDTFLAEFGHLFQPRAWLVLLQGEPAEIEACRKAVGGAAGRRLTDVEFGRIKQVRSAASDGLAVGVSNPNPDPHALPPVPRAARFLTEAIREFAARGIRPKAEHNHGLLHVFLASDEERAQLARDVDAGRAFDDGSLALHARFAGDLTAFLEAALAPVVTEEMLATRTAVNFPGNEDLLVRAEQFPETMQLLERLMRTYSACPVPLYYCHVNFRRQPGWLLVHNRLLLDVAEFEGQRAQGR